MKINCRKEIYFIPSNELDEIDYYGMIVDGKIPDSVQATIDKKARVALVSQGFIFQYWRMKEKLIDLGYDPVTLEKRGEQNGRSIEE